MLRRASRAFLAPAVPDVLPDQVARAERSAPCSTTKIKALAEVGAGAPARLLHRLSGAADLRGDEAGREGARRRTTSRPTSAAICSRSCRPSISARPRWATASGRPRPRPSTCKADKRSISVMGDGGFWHNGLTSRHRQRRLQQARRRHPRRRQYLFRGHRRPGHPVVARRQPIALDQASDHQGGEGHRRRHGCARSTAPMTSARCATR